MNWGGAPGGALLAQTNERTKIVGAQTAERRKTKRSAQNKSKTGKTACSGEGTLWRGPQIDREPDFLTVDFLVPGKSDFALGPRTGCTPAAARTRSKKQQLASRKRRAENEERGGNKNLHAAEETKNQNRRTTINQQRTRQITRDQNKLKVQIPRYQNSDDFNPWTWTAQTSKEVKSDFSIEVHTRFIQPRMTLSLI
jgi:hypothetical protein